MLNGDASISTGVQQHRLGLVRQPNVRRRHKDRRSPSLATDIDPIQHQHVEMRIEIQRTAEALDKGHRVALDVGVALCSGLHR
ncbi:MAG: hypothetical protein ACI8PG_000196 [Planctomycetota bacterium]|jgi:hypothetical protein